MKVEQDVHLSSIVILAVQTNEPIKVPTICVSSVRAFVTKKDVSIRLKKSACFRGFVFGDGVATPKKFGQRCLQKSFKFHEGSPI